MPAQHKARLTVDVRAVFWREGDGWRGECIELEASSQAETFRIAYQELTSAAYSSANQEIQAGRLPVRHLSTVDEALLARWHALPEKGDRHTVQDLCRDDSGVNEARLSLTLQIEERIPNAEEDPDLGPITILLLEEDGAWVAQCLEYDIGGQGPTQEAAIAAAADGLRSRVMVDRLLGREPMADVDAAPRRYWDVYETAEPIDNSDDPDHRFRNVRAAA